MKVAIITMHAARNYGAVLQTYALQYTFEKKYHTEPFIINYVSTHRKNSRYFLKVVDKYKNSKIKSILFITAAFPSRLYSQIQFSRFVKKYLKIDSQRVTNIQELRLAKFDADIFCVGSDQVWNPNHNDGVDEGFYLTFANKKTKKISYASSIGTSDISSDNLNKMRELLADFNYLSYRERSSKEIFSKMKLDAEWVLDPTLLMCSKEWDEFAHIKEGPHEKYLLLYWFGNPSSVMDKVHEIANERGLRIIRISTVLKSYPGDDIVEKLPTVKRFVELFSNADFIVTDSFHGTAFSINYHKQFYACPARKLDDRFYSIFEMFDLYDRDLDEERCKLSKSDIDYEKVESRLSDMRNKSFAYLDKALKI